MESEFDPLVTSCRLLGHIVPFQYCREANRNLPCRHILNCWFEQIPVKEFIEQNYRPEDLEVIFAPPEPKLDALLRLIEEAKKK